MPTDVFVHGSCTPNPGPGRWAFCYEQDGAWVEQTGNEADSTNPRIELLAAIAALEHFTDGAVLTLTTDSEAVQKGATERIQRWKGNGWRNAQRKPISHIALWKHLDAVAAKRTVEWRWISAKAGNAGVGRARNLVLDHETQASPGQRGAPRNLQDESHLLHTG